MNTTERLLQSRPHGDVREASRGGSYPHGVIIHMDPVTGMLEYRGFNACTGLTTPFRYADRDCAIKALHGTERLICLIDNLQLAHNREVTHS